MIMEILKVSSKSNPSKVAGAIANVFRSIGSVEIQTIGAGSLNQAIKAICIARGFVAPSGKNLIKANINVYKKSTFLVDLFFSNY